MRRTKKTEVVWRRMRVYRTVIVKRKIIQCELPYALFGQAVANARVKLGITQQTLADKLKLSRGSIANIEVGRQRILLGDVFEFAKVLKITPMSLFRAVMK